MIKIADCILIVMIVVIYSCMYSCVKSTYLTTVHSVVLQNQILDIKYHRLGNNNIRKILLVSTSINSKDSNSIISVDSVRPYSSLFSLIHGGIGSDHVVFNKHSISLVENEFDDLELEFIIECTIGNAVFVNPESTDTSFVEDGFKSDSILERINMRPAIVKGVGLTDLVNKQMWALVEYYNYPHPGYPCLTNYVLIPLEIVD